MPLTVAQSVERGPASAWRSEILTFGEPDEITPRFLLNLSILLTLAAGAPAQDVKLEYDHQANFFQYHPLILGKG
ncbi:MAG TPA: hypothetical protein VN901_26460 [Candidatus Acidoferrales bacterium]|nr:hypothetical protein [Candidatus Acidoferrales bacterium]